MLRILVPVILAVVGLVGGGVVGATLKPKPEMVDEDPTMEEDLVTIDEIYATGSAAAPDSEYVELSRKLIVPITRGDGRQAYLAIDLHLEMNPGGATLAGTHEPKIRDGFLRTLVAFSATGAFDDHVHANAVLDELGRELLKTARGVLGDEVRNVLIGDLIVQDA